MKTRQYIFRTLMLMLPALVAVSANAASLTHELGDNVTVTWYTNQDKTGPISTVTMSADDQTIYVDIQPASGFWTDINYLQGVEKIGSAANAGSRRTRTVPSYGGLGAIAKISTLTYGSNGAGVYQVTVPALAAGQTDSQIAEICLKGTILESTNLSTATITATSATYSGVAQTASTISVALGTTDLVAGTDYTVTTNDGGTNAGKYAVGITGMGRYKGTASNATAFEITTKALTITANAQTITYGGSISSTTSDVTIDSTNGLADGDELTSITLAKSATDYSATAYANDITPSNAVVKRGENIVTSNYSITYGKGDLTINKASFTPAVTMAGWTYGGTATVPDVSGNTSGGAVSYTYKAEGASEYDADKPTNAGTHTVKATIAATANYNGAEVTNTYTVSKRVAELSWGNLEFTYSGEAQQPTATVSNLVGSDECTVSISGNGLTPETYTATATTLSNSNYQLPTTVTQDFTIGKAALTVTAKPKTITYGDAPANDDVEYGGFVNGETSVVLGGTLSYAYNYAQYGAVGSYTITPSGQTSDNYDITFATGALTVQKKALTINAKDQTITYGGSISSATSDVTIDTTNGLVAGDELTSISLTKTETNYSATAYANDITPSNAVVKRGENIVTSNYSITYGKGDLTINKASFTPAVTMAGWTYGGTATVPDVSGNTSGGAVSYTYKAEGASEYDADKPTNAGTHTVKATIAATANYNGAEVTNTYTVSKRVAELSWGNLEFTYSGEAQQPTATVSNLVGSDECTVSISGNGLTPETYTATATTLSNSNYQLPTTVTQDFTIGKAALTVTAKPKTITYGDAPANDDVEYGGFVNGETSVVLGGTLSYAYNYAQYGAVGSYTITPSGQTSDNYDITFATGALTVQKKALTINAKDQTITYGGSISSATSDVTIDTTNGLVAGDELTSISLTKTETNYSATAYDDDITPSDAVVMRGEADVTANYNISYGKGDLTINKADLTISADNKEREVSEANPTFTVSYSGFVNGDDASKLTIEPIIGCNATASSPVGTYTITPSGAEAANYNIIYNNATLTIYRNFNFTGPNVWRTWYGSEDLTVNANHMETYVVTGVTASEVTVTQTENGEIYKNTPMLLKFKLNSTTPTIRADAAGAELTPPGGLSSSFIGGLDDLTTYIGCEVYILAGSEFVRTSVTEGNTAFDASKCFVYISGAAASRLSIGDDTTDIRVVERESTNDEWYTINGQKLGKRPIRPGVYIHNNKKVVVK